MNEQDILNLISSDREMVRALESVRTLELPDWWIGAGFVRNKVWDFLSGYDAKTTAPDMDVDVIYFDPTDTSEDSEKGYEQKLLELMPNERWSVKNQARMHVVNGDALYTSTEDALSRWVETATAVAVKIDTAGKLQLLAPYGIDDLVSMVIRVSPKFSRPIEIFHKRVEKKNWTGKWPRVKVAS